ncbi:MAG: hypothetical protein M0R80_04245 [Proteobacteria bacterium]|nr:hypothetical protein [Pseudomonadota bacterium]
MDTTKLDWSLFTNQEKEISTINNELYALRKQKYPEYRDSYYRYYNEFGMRGMIGDLYRKFDRLKIMSESYFDSEIVSKEKEITDQFYDIISYCQLQLYWLRKEKWGGEEKHNTGDLWSNTTSGDLKLHTRKDGISVVYVPAQSVVPSNIIGRGAKILDEIVKTMPDKGLTITLTMRIPNDIDEKKLRKLIAGKLQENLGR